VTLCRYSVACVNEATTTIDMPPLGKIPTCQPCKELYGRLSGKPTNS
jgi:hypothetical protein